MIRHILWQGTTSDLVLYTTFDERHTHSHTRNNLCRPTTIRFVFTHRLLKQKTPVHLRSLECRQNIGLLLLMCSWSCREGILGAGSDQNISMNVCVAASAGQCPFWLTLNRDLEGGAVTLVFCRHLTPVAPSISRDHLDDLHFISVDLGVGGIWLVFSF